MCVGIEGTIQDRRCTYDDYYWYGIPGALGDQFLAAWAGASDGVGFNVPMLVDCSSYNKYKDNSAYWIGDAVGVLTAVLTLTAAADIRIPSSWASQSRSAAVVYKGASLPPSGLVNSSSIRFSQNSMKSTFSEGGPVSDLATGLKNGSVSVSSIPPIRLVARDGGYFTLDNRRLWAFQEAGLDVPYRLATPSEAAAEAWKFTTINGGISIKVRGAR